MTRSREPEAASEENRAPKAMTCAARVSIWRGEELVGEGTTFWKSGGPVYKVAMTGARRLLPNGDTQLWTQAQLEAAGLRITEPTPAPAQPPAPRAPRTGAAAASPRAEPELRPSAPHPKHGRKRVPVRQLQGEASGAAGAGPSGSRPPVAKRQRKSDTARGSAAIASQDGGTGASGSAAASAGAGEGSTEDASATETGSAEDGSGAGGASAAAGGTAAGGTRAGRSGARPRTGAGTAIGDAAGDDPAAGQEGSNVTPLEPGRGGRGQEAAGPGAGAGGSGDGDGLDDAESGGGYEGYAGDACDDWLDHGEQQGPSEEPGAGGAGGDGEASGQVGASEAGGGGGGTGRRQEGAAMEASGGAGGREHTPAAQSTAVEAERAEAGAGAGRAGPSGPVSGPAPRTEGGARAAGPETEQQQQQSQQPASTEEETSRRCPAADAQAADSTSDSPSALPAGQRSVARAAGAQAPPGGPLLPPAAAALTGAGAGAGACAPAAELGAAAAGDPVVVVEEEEGSEEVDVEAEAEAEATEDEEGAAVEGEQPAEDTAHAGPVGVRPGGADAAAEGQPSAAPAPAPAEPVASPGQAPAASQGLAQTGAAAAGPLLCRARSCSRGGAAAALEPQASAAGPGQLDALQEATPPGLHLRSATPIAGTEPLPATQPLPSRKEQTPVVQQAVSQQPGTSAGPAVGAAAILNTVVPLAQPHPDQRHQAPGPEQEADRDWLSSPQAHTAPDSPRSCLDMELGDLDGPGEPGDAGTQTQPEQLLPPNPFTGRRYPSSLCLRPGDRPLSLQLSDPRLHGVGANPWPPAGSRRVLCVVDEFKGSGGPKLLVKFEGYELDPGLPRGGQAPARGGHWLCETTLRAAAPEALQAWRSGTKPEYWTKVEPMEMDASQPRASIFTGADTAGPRSSCAAAPSLGAAARATPARSGTGSVAATAAGARTAPQMGTTPAALPQKAPVVAAAPGAGSPPAHPLKQQQEHDGSSLGPQRSLQPQPRAGGSPSQGAGGSRAGGPAGACPQLNPHILAGPSGSRAALQLQRVPSPQGPAAAQHPSSILHVGALGLRVTPGLQRPFPSPQQSPPQSPQSLQALLRSPATQPLSPLTGPALAAAGAAPGPSSVLRADPPQSLPGAARGPLTGFPGSALASPSQQGLGLGGLGLGLGPALGTGMASPGSAAAGAAGGAAGAGGSLAGPLTSVGQVLSGLRTLSPDRAERIMADARHAAAWAAASTLAARVAAEAVAAATARTSPGGASPRGLGGGAAAAGVGGSSAVAVSGLGPVHEGGDPYGGGLNLDEDPEAWGLGGLDAQEESGSGGAAGRVAAGTLPAAVPVVALGMPPSAVGAAASTGLAQTQRQGQGQRQGPARSQGPGGSRQRGGSQPTRSAGPKRSGRARKPKRPGSWGAGDSSGSEEEAGGGAGSRGRGRGAAPKRRKVEGPARGAVQNQSLPALMGAFGFSEEAEERLRLEVAAGAWVYCPTTGRRYPKSLCCRPDDTLLVDYDPAMDTEEGIVERIMDEVPAAPGQEAHFLIKWKGYELDPGGPGKGHWEPQQHVDPNNPARRAWEMLPRPFWWSENVQLAAGQPAW
ncbi:hypothetical protein HYH03_008090 [Edaphochlamys debaryana]|uniref:Chromo domain-containing protein n=1 Tax=Edaphochlamys debaryana TaxID=47281 RepID=A0A836BY89_9CHLO|nr:hypothetical protein HYH03_008090 [Edaphochlamys debaryana]|eukprot:KAG2493571.1 hypothetical protein HYH03_008090 [Edaphochlamys debaryana]